MSYQSVLVPKEAAAVVYSLRLLDFRKIQVGDKTEHVVN